MLAKVEGNTKQRKRLGLSCLLSYITFSTFRSFKFNPRASSLRTWSAAAGNKSSRVFVMAPSRRKASSVPEGKSMNLVPSLEETGRRYLKSVHPLLSPAEYERTSHVVSKFVRPGGEGEPLQKRLLARRDDPNIGNWIIEWWNHASYLGYRDPVVPYVSYFYSYRDPLAMSSYVYMFNCCRIPAEGADYPQKYPHQENPHIVVLRKNQFFKLPVVVHGQQLTTAELQKQFERIYERADRGAAPVSVLTATNRDFWAATRDKLLAASPANARALRGIESSGFLVCLDDAAPVTLEERAHQYWHGDGCNRWFDKPLQFVINDNGTAGFNGEHSMMDGTPTHRLNDYVNKVIFNSLLDFDNPSMRSDLPDPTPLIFQLNTEVEKAIADALREHQSHMAAHELRVQAFQAYGKGLIKKFKCSPDAYVQMLIQLAYFKMYGLNRPTYESVATHKFQEGRTETTRSVSDESVAFCRAQADPAVSREEVVQLFRAALAAHTKYTLEATEGRGVDRHLFGLKRLLREGEKLPALYEDLADDYSKSWYLSTSQLSSEYFNGYGWSQVIDDGFGIAYMINEESLQFNIVCKRMSFYLNEAACEVRDLLMPDLLTQHEKAKL
ncbi:Acyltransferase ChoActase/COT/CPT [Elaphomyces granulatus]